MSDIISGHSFSFDSGVATHCGVNAALVYAHICFWIKENAANDVNFHQEKYWMFQKQEVIAKHFEFLTTKQVRDSIKILVDKELLIKGNFNKNSFDQMSWYAVPDSIFQKIVTKRRNCRIESDKSVSSEATKLSLVYKGNTIKKNINERNVEDVEVVDNQEPEEIIPSKTKNVQNHRTKSSGRPIPEFLGKMKIPDNDKQILVNQFSDNEICLALEDARSYHNKKEKIKNLPAFLTQRCKHYRRKRSG